ncbi:MAG: hypothetical protein K5772_05215 [Clostridia bacterium]|nr:hypothetical protein [Clostridia bacterium]
MKKFCVLLTLALLFALALGGCSSGDETEIPDEPLFGIDGTEEGVVSVVGNGAGTGEGGSTTITVGENQVLYCEIFAEPGESLRIGIYSLDKVGEDFDFSDESLAEAILSPETDLPEMWPLEAGEYTLLIQVRSDSFTGTASIRALNAAE